MLCTCMPLSLLSPGLSVVPRLRVICEVVPEIGHSLIIDVKLERRSSTKKALAVTGSGGYNAQNMDLLLYVYDKTTYEIYQVIKKKIE